MNLKKILISICLLVTLPSLWAEDPVDPLTTYEGLSAAIQAKPKNFFVVDCRTWADFRGGHIPTAISVPLEKISYTPPTKDLNATIVLYCRFGNRSDRARTILESLGYKNIHLFGKFIKWKGDVEK